MIEDEYIDGVYIPLDWREKSPQELRVLINALIREGRTGSGWNLYRKRLDTNAPPLRGYDPEAYVEYAWVLGYDDHIHILGSNRGSRCGKGVGFLPYMRVVHSLGAYDPCQQCMFLSGLTKKAMREIGD